MRLLLALCGIGLCLHAQHGQQLLISQKISSGGSTPAVTSKTCTTISAVSGDYTVPTFTTSAGDALFIGIANGNDDTGNTGIGSVSSKIGGVPTGDTFTEITGNNSHNSFQTVYGYSALSVSGGSYVITIASGAAPPTSIVEVCVLEITHVTTQPLNCVGAVGSGQTTCSTSITPTASPAVFVGFMADYYFADTFTAGTGFTTGATAAAGANGNAGSAANEYKICSSSCTSTAVTPAYSITGTNYTGIIGALYQ